MSVSDSKTSVHLPVHGSWFFDVLLEHRVADIVNYQPSGKCQGVEISSEEEGGHEDDHRREGEKREDGEELAQGIIDLVLHVGQTQRLPLVLVLHYIVNSLLLLSYGNYLKSKIPFKCGTYMIIMIIGNTGCSETSCKFLRLVTQSFFGLFSVFWAFLYHKLWAIFHSSTSGT